MRRIAHPEKVRWNLKRALFEKRMMVTELAEKVGSTRNYLSHVVMGRYPGYPYRKKISKVLGYPVDWLFKIGDESIPQSPNHNIFINIIHWFKSVIKGHHER